MTLNLLSKAQLALINRQTLQYSLAEAEKDYFLAVASKIIYDSGLRHKIIFKGGTALHHCYLPQLRFSEDLDFTSLDPAITLEEAKQVLESSGLFSIRKDYVSRATIKLERVQYTGLLGQPNSLKVEIDRIQNVVLPTRELPYRNVWRVDTLVNVMDIREICAEKIRAMNDRVRYRDFFDFYLIMEQLKPPLDEVFDLVHKKEVRQVIAQEHILEHWEMAQLEKQKEASVVYYATSIFNDDARIGEALKQLHFEPVPVNSKYPN